MRTFPLTKFLSITLSGVLLLETALFAQMENPSIWSERNSSEQPMVLASLPASFIPHAQPMMTWPSNSGIASPKKETKELLDFLATQAKGASRKAAAVKPVQGPLVVHIRDVHQNFEAQTNIASLVKRLVSYGADLLVLEGMNGEFDLSPARATPHQDLLRKAAEYELKKGGISGPLFAALTFSSSFPRVVGMENPSLYRKNIQAVKDADALADSTRALLKQSSDRLVREMDASLNPRLLSFEKLVRAHQEEKILFGDFVSLLLEKAPSASFALSVYQEAAEAEKRMNFPQVEKEREVLLSRLTPKLSPAELSRLFERSLRAQAGQESVGELYRDLETLAASKGILIGDFPAFRSYIRYTLLADSINVSVLLSEVEDHKEMVRSSLIENKKEAVLVSLSETAHLLGKLSDLSLTRDEWMALQGRLKNSAVLNALELPASALQPFLSFYETAHLRDAAMAKNLKAWADKTGASTIVAVAGGFHSAGFSKELEALGFTVAHLDPSLTAIEKESGLETLSVFARERTPLERIVKGDSLFLAAPPALSVPQIPVDMAAVGAAKNIPVQKPLPYQENQTKITASAPSSDSAQVYVSGQNGAAAISYQIDGQGNVTRSLQRQAASEPLLLKYINPFPEFFGFAVLYLFPILEGPDAWLYFGLPAGLALRLLWMISEVLVHDGGHAFGKMLTDFHSPFTAASEVFSQFRFSSLLPLAPIHVPGEAYLAPVISTGDTARWKVSVKALFGPLFTGALFGSTLYLIGWSDMSFGPIAAGVLYATLFLNGIILLTSEQDYQSFFSGIAPLGFFCGVFGLVAQSQDDKNLMPVEIEERLSHMGAHTQVRGRQAGGGLVVGRDKNGRAIFVGGKYVNPKRSNLTTLVMQKIHRLVQRAEKKGARPMDTLLGLFHWRFGTSSAPSVLETHWHEWVPPETVSAWKVIDGKVQAVSDTHNIRIVHNGDFNGLTANPNLSVFGQPLKLGELGDSLNRVLYPNETQGDSPKIAGVMTLLTTQGVWSASARLAYLLEIEKDLKNPFPQFFEPKEIKKRVSRGKYTTTLVDNNSHKKVKALMDDLGFTMEDIFSRHARDLFPSSVKKLSDINKDAIPEFIDTVVEALRFHAVTKKWSVEDRRRFAETALDAFLHNELSYATKIFMTIPEKTSSFGLGAVSSLEPEKVVLAAHGQPIALVNSQSGRITTFASEPAAAISGVPEDDARVMDLDDEGGEVAVITAESVELYSIKERRDLSREEVEERWLPIKDNPYLSSLAAPYDNEDLIAEDLSHITQNAHNIFNEFNSKDSWNRQTVNNLLPHLIKIGQKEFQTRTPQGQHMVLIGEEKSFETAERFRRDMRAIFPHLKISILSGNQYLKNRSKLFRLGVLNEDTVVMGISQSGQTYPTLKAIRSAEKARKEGRVADVFVLTGEWNSKMGQALGQGYHPDDEFIGRVFSNLSGRRRSEASTISLLSTDFLLTQIFLHITREMKKALPEDNAFSPNISDEDLKILEEQARYYINVSLPSITGRNFLGIKQEPGENKQLAYQQLVSEGRRWADHLMENFTVTMLLVAIVFSTVATGWVPSQILVHGVGSILSLFYPGASDAVFGLLNYKLISVFDATVYASLYWILAGVLRWAQARPIMARTGNRNITIVGPVNQTLRNYAKRVFGEAWGHFQPRVDAATAENLVNYEAASVARGGLLFAQYENDNPVAEGQLQELAATRMALSQADGIRNFGNGLEILALQFDPTVNFTYPSVSLRSKEERNARPASSEEENINEVISSRFRHAELLASGFVFFHAMADKTARFNLELYSRRTTSRWELFISVPFSVLSWVISRSFLLLNSFLHQVILGTTPLSRLFVPGATQSGTAIATTQMTPDLSGAPSQEEALELEETAENIKTLGAQNRNWIPQSEKNKSPFFLAAVYPALGEQQETGQDEADDTPDRLDDPEISPDATPLPSEVFEFAGDQEPVELSELFQPKDALAIPSALAELDMEEETLWVGFEQPSKFRFWGKDISLGLSKVKLTLVPDKPYTFETKEPGLIARLSDDQVVVSLHPSVWVQDNGSKIDLPESRQLSMPLFYRAPRIEETSQEPRAPVFNNPTQEETEVLYSPFDEDTLVRPAPFYGPSEKSPVLRRLVFLALAFLLMVLPHGSSQSASSNGIPGGSQKIQEVIPASHSREVEKPRDDREQENKTDIPDIFEETPEPVEEEKEESFLDQASALFSPVIPLFETSAALPDVVTAEERQAELGKLISKAQDDIKKLEKDVDIAISLVEKVNEKVNSANPDALLKTIEALSADIDKKKEEIHAARAEIPQLEQKAKEAENSFREAEAGQAASLALADLFSLINERKELEIKITDLQETLNRFQSEKPALTGEAKTALIKEIEEYKAGEEALSGHVRWAKDNYPQNPYGSELEGFGIAHQFLATGRHTWDNPWVSLKDAKEADIFTVDELIALPKARQDELGLRVKPNRGGVMEVAVYPFYGPSAGRTGTILKPDAEVFIREGDKQPEIFSVRRGMKFYSDRAEELTAKLNAPAEPTEDSRLVEKELAQLESQAAPLDKQIKESADALPDNAEALAQGKGPEEWNGLLSGAEEKVENSRNELKAAQFRLAQAEESLQGFDQDIKKAGRDLEGREKQFETAKNLLDRAKKTQDIVEGRLDAAKENLKKLNEDLAKEKKLAEDSIPSPMLIKPQVNPVDEAPLAAPVPEKTEVAEKDADPVETLYTPPVTAPQRSYFTWTIPFKAHLYQLFSSVNYLYWGTGLFVLIAALWAGTRFFFSRPKAAPKKAAEQLSDDDILFLVETLGGVKAGRESGRAYVLLNKILDGIDLEFRVIDPLAAATGPTPRGVFLEQVLARVSESPKFRAELQSKLDHPSVKGAQEVFSKILQGAAGEEKVFTHVTDHEAVDSQLTLAAVRGPWWSLMKDETREQFLISLDQAHRHGSGGKNGRLVLSAETKQQGLELVDWVKKLDLKIQVTVIPGLYQEWEEGVQFSLVNLESGLEKGRISLGDYSRIRLITSPTVISGEGLGVNSLLMDAIVDMLDSSLNVVGNGVARDLATVDKIAKLVGSNA